MSCLASLTRANGTQESLTGPPALLEVRADPNFSLSVTYLSAAPCICFFTFWLEYEPLSYKNRGHFIHLSQNARSPENYIQVPLIAFFRLVEMLKTSSAPASSPRAISARLIPAQVKSDPILVTMSNGHAMAESIMMCD